MVQTLKNKFFFPVATYFAFFARIQLMLWHPRVIVVTGSSGKTTLFSFIESQIGNKAHYSHHANSAIGIPFDILGLHRKSLEPVEWIELFLKAPLQAFKKPYSQKLYVAECDADRPGEGKFLANLLKPEVTLWISSSRTHSMNFDYLVPESFKSVEEAIAYEFGNFIAMSKNLVTLNADSDLEKDQIHRTKAEVKDVGLRELINYQVSSTGTSFKTKSASYKFKQILPKEVFYAIGMSKLLCEYLDVEFDKDFKNLELPPARSNLFKGIKETTLIDSTYNANLSSMTAVLSMFKQFPGVTKWLVIGDMLEQGSVEQEEHEKLAHLIADLDVQRIVLLGPRVSTYTYPVLQELVQNVPIDSFENPKDVLDLLKKEIQGGEVILFKGARFLEGVIENLLKDKSEKKLLARREAVWEKRRKKWGL